MRPVALGLASFLLQRAFEFVRNDICIPCANVKLVGIGGGFAFSHMGVSHHATEDVGLARLLPSLEVCVPATPSEVAHWVRVLSDDPRPWYIRLAANDPHALEDEAMAAAPDSFGIREWMDGTDVVLIAVGPIVREVLDAAKLLIARGIRPRVLSAALLAPLTAGAIVKYVAPAHTVVVAEDHQRVGGFGEVIEQSVIASDQRARVVRLGVQGMPGEAHGTLQTLRQYYQLDARAIYAAATRTGD
jgi:transketolase